MVSALLNCEPVTVVFPQTLHGGVVHTQSLPPVPNLMNIEGSKFDPSVTEIIWYQIPGWLGGKFRTTSSVITPIASFMNNGPTLPYRTRSQSVQSYGRQLDALGNCWEAELLPYVQAWNLGISRVKQIVLEKRATYEDEATLVLRIRGLNLVTAPFGNFVIKTSQDESIKIITRLPNGFAVTDDVMSYSTNGAPLRRYIARYTAQRIEDFHTTNEERGINLRSSLNDYFKQNGREDLIPLSAPQGE